MCSHVACGKDPDMYSRSEENGGLIKKFCFFFVESYSNDGSALATHGSGLWPAYKEVVISHLIYDLSRREVT